MIFSPIGSYVLFLLPLATAQVVLQRPVPHVAEDIVVAPRNRNKRGPIPVGNGTATSTGPSSLITEAPTTGWPTYSRVWPSPGCSIPPLASSDWCRVNMHTVEVHFWPTGAAAGNRTFPSTYYLSEYDVTMTRPSIYYVIDRVWATDYCGQDIGPTQTNFIGSYDLTDVSTLQPYADATAKSRMGTAQQLELSDLRTDCPTPAASEIPAKNHNTNKDGCNPVLAYPILLKGQVANGAWHSCGRYVGGKMGIYDPPVPVAACYGDDCGDLGAASSPPITSSPTPTAAPDQAAPTTTPSPPAVPSPSTNPIPSATAAPTTSIPVPSPTKTPAVPTETEPETPSTPAKSVSAPETTNSTTPVQDTPTPTVPGTVETSNPSPQIPNLRASTPAAIVTLPNSIVVSAVPGASEVFVGTQILTSGARAITIPGGDVLSFAPSGVVVHNTDSGAIQTLPLPDASILTPQTLGVVAGNTISGVAVGSSAVAIGTQILNLGGPVVTLSGNQVASLGSSGIIVQAPSGVVTTILLAPTPTATEAETLAPVIDVAPAPTGTETPEGGKIPATASASGAATITSLGGIIYSTFEGGAGRSMDLGIAGLLGFAVLGMMVWL